MKRSYTRGVRWLIVFTLSMIIASGFVIKYTVNGFKSLENLYNEGEYFNGSRGYSIIKVLGVEELTIEDEILEQGEKFYMLESEHAFVILKSTREDLKKVIGDRLREDEKMLIFDEDIYARIDAVPEKTKSGRRSRTKINIKPELLEKFKEESKKSTLIWAYLVDFNKDKKTESTLEKLKERPFYYNTYITPSGNGYYIRNVSISLLIIIITVIMMSAIIISIRRAKANYENMFITYPEVERNRDILFREAKYIDEKLKVLIYKESLVVYKGVFSFSLLDNLAKVSFKELTSKGRIIGYSIVLQTKGPERDTTIRLGGKKDKEKIEELADYIRRNSKVTVSDI